MESSECRQVAQEKRTRISCAWLMASAWSSRQFGVLHIEYANDFGRYVLNFHEVSAFFENSDIYFKNSLIVEHPSVFGLTL